jgi:predicted acetyltransferase
LIGYYEVKNMPALRPARPADRAEFRGLWDMCFTDSENFRNWFFENRYIPSYSVCMEEDGKIVSEAQSVPYNIKVRDSVVYGTMMVGACTHPDYTRRGYMKEIYKYYMNLMYKMGVVVCAHTPAVLRTYFYVGHYPVSDTAFIEIEKSEGCENSKAVDVDMRLEESMLMECYMKAAEKYSGIIYRSLADFRLKCADYAADGGKCIAYIENEECLAYAVYYDTGDMVYAEEVIAVDAESEQIIADAIAEKGRGRKVTIKLPPDSKTVRADGEKTVAPRNVCGIANAAKLLKAVGKGLKNTVKITDEVIEENNGVFDLCGNRVEAEAQIEMPVYRFAQWIFGYRSLAELEEAGEIKVNDKAAAVLLDKELPKQVCHIVDEY